MEGETMANEDKRTWAEIDLGRLYHNYREVRRVLPEGCRFAERCPYATERCNASSPEAYEIEPGHFVKCFKVKEGEK